jgi:methionyl-tRNA synthetase
MISIEDFKKIEIKIGEILSAEPIPESEKLLKLSVDFGPKPQIQNAKASPDQPDTILEPERDIRQVLSGIASYFPDPKALIGKHCAFVTNLEPRVMMGMESQAMILATTYDESLVLFEVPDSIPSGNLVR